MDETIYEKLDADISEAMKHAERMCNLHKYHATPWAKSLVQAAHTISYWDARVSQRGNREFDDEAVNYYLARSNVYKERHDTTMTITACINQLNSARRQLKDVANNGAFYEVEVTIACVEKSFPHFTEDNVVCAIEREEKIELELKAQENRRNTQGSFRELGRQIQGHVKPKYNNKSSIIGKDELEDH
jgi:hypothetical protein